MIFCARATRGLRRPSLGLRARLGVPLGGRVRKLRAVEDQSAPIPEELMGELGGITRSFVRYTRRRPRARAGAPSRSTWPWLVRSDLVGHNLEEFDLEYERRAGLD